MSLLDCLATTDALAAIFSDESVVAAMLEFESALARAAAAAGVIPATAARTISEAALRGGFDTAAIARAARTDATPVIPLVKALRERVHLVDPASATYVHWGATSQDVTDTALVLLLEQARVPIAADHGTARPCAADALGTARGHGDAGADAAAARHADHVRPQGRRLDVGHHAQLAPSARRVVPRAGHPVRRRRGHACGARRSGPPRGRRDGARARPARGPAVAHQPRSARCAGDGVRTLRRGTRQGRPRHHPVDAGRSWRGRRTWWRIVDDAAQAESRPDARWCWRRRRACRRSWPRT